MFTIGFPEFAIILVLLVILAFEIAMFVDVMKNETLSQNSRIIWAVAMVLIHPFVAIYYYFTEYRR